jgi:hypothetical protein
MCAAMGCTYTEYIQQPTWFVDLYKIKLEVEAEHDKRTSK